MKKLISVCLAIIMLAVPMSVISFAAPQGTAGSFTVCNYNVAGLPDIGFLQDKEPVDVPMNQTCIGRFFTENQFDIVAVQEDFGYHRYLVKNMPDYKYMTMHEGMVPYADGTNIFTLNSKLYNEAHIPWNMRAGVLDDGADALSEKGITYCCIEIAEGILIDFYNIHADAFSGEESIAARRDNFRQLAAIINSRTTDRPVIVTGDFNDYFFGNDNLRDDLVEPCQLKDAWIEVCNNGDYNDCSEYMENQGCGWADKWGKWDSVERFLYKDGGGISLSCDTFEYVWVTNGEGQKCSDHAASVSTFSYEVTEEQKDTGELTEEKTDIFTEFFRRVKSFFKALVLLLGSLAEKYLPELTVPVK